MPSLEIEVSGGFDFDKIMKFQPFFFFFDNEPVRSVLLQGAPLEMKFRKSGWALHADISREVSEAQKKYLASRLAYCFGADENLSAFYAMCENDEVLKKFLENIQGNRLISAFDDFEAIVSIICSQNVSFAQYKQMVRNIVKTCGYKNCFPSPRDIIEKRALLKNCGVGYRDSFIMEAAKKMMLKATLSDDDINNLHGIGPYSRDIFRLFQRRDYSMFYVDTLIKKIFREQYGATLETDADVRVFAGRKFGKLAGLAEIYLQKFINDNPFFVSPPMDEDGSTKKALTERKA